MRGLGRIQADPGVARAEDGDLRQGVRRRGQEQDYTMHHGCRVDGVLLMLSLLGVLIAGARLDQR